ncbi:MAG: DUF1697 domain-containing protein [Bryobacteraceae bacterium]
MVVISLLRGVNVGGHNQIKMDSLRDLFESLGLRDARTHVQSGNVIFRTEKRDLVRLTGRIEDGIERNFGFRPRVIARTVPKLRDVVARNPFAGRQGIEPSKLLVIFLAEEPSEALREKIRAIKAEPEELQIENREFYIYFPNGMARPKLSPALIEKTLKIAGTGRNWNSVTKLLEIAEKMETL